MYLGVVVESAPTRELWRVPQHPYTEALIAAIPHADGSGLLPEALPGEVPDPSHPPSGCRFHPRCPHVFERCSGEVPPLYEVGPRRHAACFLRDSGTSHANPVVKELT
jgi:peptide/nickel transport system ATP-binding protein